MTPAVLTTCDMRYPSVAKCAVVSAVLSGEQRIATSGIDALRAAHATELSLPVTSLLERKAVETAAT